MEDINHLQNNEFQSKFDFAETKIRNISLWRDDLFKSRSVSVRFMGNQSCHLSNFTVFPFNISI